jgi:ParB-like chromosome segregation protein Spo0J
MQVASSIKEFGFTNPILIDDDGGIIAGHGRLMAAKKLGLVEVPCIRLGHLTEAQKKAYVIVDNKLALNAGWNNEALKIEIEALQELDFNIDLIGFNFDELEALINPNDGIVDFSEKNKELDLDNFNDEMQMKFNFAKDQYDFISERLSNINDSKEIALLSILNYEL